MDLPHIVLWVWWGLQFIGFVQGMVNHQKDWSSIQISTTVLFSIVLLSLWAWAIINT